MEELLMLVGEAHLVGSVRRHEQEPDESTVGTFFGTALLQKSLEDKAEGSVASKAVKAEGFL